MFTDADIETLEMEDAARMADAGVCPICEDVLNPLDPKWAAEFPKRDGSTAERWAELVGPVDWNLRMHVRCLEEDVW